MWKYLNGGRIRGQRVRSANVLSQDLAKSIVKRDGDGGEALSDFQHDFKSFIGGNHGGRFGTTVIRHWKSVELDKQGTEQKRRVL